MRQRPCQKGKRRKPENELAREDVLLGQLSEKEVEIATNKYPGLSLKEAITLHNVDISVMGKDSSFMGPFGERRIVYSDFAASGKSVRQIEDFIQTEFLPYYGNTHSEGNMVGSHVTRLREESREIVKKSCGCNDDDSVVFFGAGMTACINKLIIALGLRNQPRSVDETPVVFIGPYEHHSNELCWRENFVEVVTISEDVNGQVDVKQLDNMLKKYKDRSLKMGSFSAASNITGALTNVDEVTAVLHRHGALAFFDYAAAAPYVEICMNPDGKTSKKSKDAVFISPHKFVGGVGTPGVLLVKKKLLAIPVPTFCGGGTVMYVDMRTQLYEDDISEREEAGTPDIVGSVRCGLAFRLKEEIGCDLIHKRETEMAKRAMDVWGKNPNIFVAGNPGIPRLAFISFIIRYGDGFLHHDFVVKLLNDLFGVQGRPGCACAGPYGQELMGIVEEGLNKILSGVLKGIEGMKPGWVRLSFNYFYSERAFETVVNAISFIADHGWKFIALYKFDPITSEWHFRSSMIPHIFPSYSENISKASLDSSHFVLGKFQNTHPIAQDFHRGGKKKCSDSCGCTFASMAEVARNALRKLPELVENISLKEDKEIPQTLAEMKWYPLPHEVIKVIKNEARHGMHFSPDHMLKHVFNLKVYPRGEECQDASKNNNSIKNRKKRSAPDFDESGGAVGGTCRPCKVRPIYRATVERGFPGSSRRDLEGGKDKQLASTSDLSSSSQKWIWLQGAASAAVVGGVVALRTAGWNPFE